MYFLCKNGIYGTESEFFRSETNFYGLQNTYSIPGSTFCKTRSDNFLTGSKIFKTGSEANDPNKNSPVPRNDFFGTEMA